MLDDAPWFRRWFGFSFMPIKWQGWAATVAFLLVEAPLMLLSLQVDDGSLAWWLLAASAFALFLGFWAFVLSKTEAR
jgi:hypothetical protein